METNDLERFLPKSNGEAEFQVSPFDPELFIPSGGRIKYVIMNCCTKYFPGKHWLLLIICPDRIDLFDPLALPLECYPNGYLFPNFSWRNRRRVQPWNSDTCGAHCLLFLHLHYFRFRSSAMVMKHAYGRCRSPTQCDRVALNFLQLKSH